MSVCFLIFVPAFNLITLTLSNSAGICDSISLIGNKDGVLYNLVHLKGSAFTSLFKTPGFKIFEISSLYPLIDIASQLPFALYFVFTAEIVSYLKNLQPLLNFVYIVVSLILNSIAIVFVPFNLFISFF